MKQRFSSLDVKVIAHELQESLVSVRLSNVYDLSSRILLLKFAKPNNKHQLLIDTGFRCHLTDFARTTAAAPSPFVARLRKCLKTRRLTSVSQVGTDRIIEFSFSDGQFRLFLEFFASGNIILTDAELKIVAISRIVSEAESQEPQRIGLSYSLENRQNYQGVPTLTKDRVREALTSAVGKASATAKPIRKTKEKPGAELRRCLAGSINELPPVLVDDSMYAHKFDVTVRLEAILESDELLDELLKSLSAAREIVDNVTSAKLCKGYIFATRKAKKGGEKEQNDGDGERGILLYDDFHPYLSRRHKDDPSIEILEFDGYNKMVDEFFSSLEGQKLESRLSDREATARRRIEGARREQKNRIEGLQVVQTLNSRKAAAIEANVERVQEAMDAVNGLLSQGMDWVDVGKLVEREKKRHNPVAEIIHLPLKLAENTISLNLAEEEFEEEGEDDPFETDESGIDEDERPQVKEKESNKALIVDINLSLSPWSNAREYYDQRRTAAAKEEKTQLQTTKALKSTEKKVAEDLKKGLKQEKALLHPLRRQAWFEKFYWFVSSDGYLVLGGKDGAQSEMLYRRYLRKGDVYCHAEMHGASNIIIKNNPATPDAPIPPATLSQAGSFAVCSSDAWDSKAGMGAWCVHADQVSKSTQTGDFLPMGTFTISGKKNFLPPTQLLLGLGIMFRISDESKARHSKHRLSEKTSDGNSQIDPRRVEGEGPIVTEETESFPGEEPNDQQVDDEDMSAEEPDEDQVQEPGRHNPLQSFGNDADTEDPIEIAERVSELQVNVENESNTAADESQFAKDGEEEEDEDDDEDVADSTVATSETQRSSMTQPPTLGTATPPNKGPLKRGQKAKAKKIARKYKDQDDEDRAAAETLIGATAGRKKAEAETKAKADHETELAQAKERRRAQHERQQKVTAEHEENRRRAMEEGVDMEDGDEAEEMTSLDDLVGTPLVGDEILEAIPVCAPWMALGKFKYKAKIQPGSTKKGKAVKEVLEKWKIDSAKKGAVDENAQDTEKMWPREVELIKALKPEDIHNSVPVGKLRVVMSGGSGGGGGGGGGKGGGSSKGQGKSSRGGKGSKR